MKLSAIALLFSGLAAPALSCTFDEIGRVQLADGVWITFTDRDGEKITQGVRGQTQVHWQGVIPLSSENRSARQEWIWSGDLPDLTELPTGGQIRLSASKTFNGRPDVQVTWTIRNDGVGTDSIGGCDWPVQLLRVREEVDGRPRGELVHHFFAPGLTVLNVTVKNLFTGEEVLDPLLAVEPAGS